MLVLTRRIGEKLMIGDDIEVVLLGIKGNQARLGIKAPLDISVHREEVYDRIQVEIASGQPTLASIMPKAAKQTVTSKIVVKGRGVVSRFLEAA